VADEFPEAIHKEDAPFIATLLRRATNVAQQAAIIYSYLIPCLFAILIQC